MSKRKVQKIRQYVYHCLLKNNALEQELSLEFTYVESFLNSCFNTQTTNQNAERLIEQGIS